MELWAVQAKAENIKLILTDREREIKRRESSYEVEIKRYKDLKHEIEKNIRAKKYEIKKLENKIKNASKRIKIKENDSNLLGEGLYYLGEKLYGVDYELDLGDDSDISGISKINSSFSPGIGSPQLLEIFRRLNIGKIALSKFHTEEAKRIYQDINEIYANISEEEKDDAYSEIVRVFKDLIMQPESERPVLMNNNLDESRNNLSTIYEIDNIDKLIEEFQITIQNKKIHESEKIYQQIQNAYSSLTEDKKDMYYPKIMQVYNQILGSQMHHEAATF